MPGFLSGLLFLAILVGIAFLRVYIRRKAEEARAARHPSEIGDRHGD